MITYDRLQPLIAQYGAALDDIITLDIPSWADTPWLFEQLQRSIAVMDDQRAAKVRQIVGAGQ